MNGELSCLIVASLVLISLVVFVVMGRRMVKEGNAESKGVIENLLRQAADDIGMAVDNKGRISGVYHDRKVIINVEKVDVAELATFAAAALMDVAARYRSKSDQPGTVMRVTVELKAAQRGYFSLALKETQSSLEKLMVGSVKSGYEELDDRYSFESSPKDFVAHVFKSHELRKQAADLINNKNDSLVVNKAKLVLYYQALNLDQTNFQSMLDFITMIADASEAYPG